MGSFDILAHIQWPFAGGLLTSTRLVQVRRSGHILKVFDTLNGSKISHEEITCPDAASLLDARITYHGWLQRAVISVVRWL